MGDQIIVIKVSPLFPFETFGSLADFALTVL